MRRNPRASVKRGNLSSTRCNLTPFFPFFTVKGSKKQNMPARLPNINVSRPRGMMTPAHFAFPGTPPSCMSPLSALKCALWTHLDWKRASGWLVLAEDVGQSLEPGGCSFIKQVGTVKWEGRHLPPLTPSMISFCAAGHSFVPTHHKNGGEKREKPLWFQDLDWKKKIKADMKGWKLKFSILRQSSGPEFSLSLAFHDLLQPVNPSHNLIQIIERSMVSSQLLTRPCHLCLSNGRQKDVR